MLYSDRIDFKGSAINKTNASKECNICYHWYFLNYSFKFQPNVCNRCHDLLMMSVNLSDIAILNIKGSDYRWIISWQKWSYKIDVNRWFDWKKWNTMKKVENYKLNKIYIKVFESIYKNGKSSKIWWYWIPKIKISSQ